MSNGKPSLKKVYNLYSHNFCLSVNNEDLELVDMLQDMDEKPSEEDSVMCTPAGADKQADVDSDDGEYSQVFNEETILMDMYKRYKCK